MEINATISVGGADINVSLLDKMHDFLVVETLAGKCSLKRGGVAYHLHLQMVFRLQSSSLIAISKMIKKYFGWELSKPPSGLVMCRSLTNRGLHTFHSMIGYCSKGVDKDHYRTVDHNITAEDLQIGVEQLALHGKDESKCRIKLTQQNFADKCLMWRRWNAQHPAVLDWEKEFYLMLKSGKYIPCTSWIVGNFGRGYKLHRMQSLWRMLVMPTTILMEDVAHVFCHPQDRDSQTRRNWFTTRWMPEEPPTTDVQRDCDKVALKNAVAEMQIEHEETMCLRSLEVAATVAQHLVHTPPVRRTLVKPTSSVGDELLHTNISGILEVEEEELRRRKGKNKVEVCNSKINRIEYCSMPNTFTGQVDVAAEESRIIERNGPMKGSSSKHLWPAEWAMHERPGLLQSSSSYSSEGLAFGEYCPVLYKRPKAAVIYQ